MKLFPTQVSADALISCTLELRPICCKVDCTLTYCIIDLLELDILKSMVQKNSGLNTPYK